MKNNHSTICEIGKVEPSGRLSDLDLAKVQARSNRSRFNFPYPHHDPVKDSLYLSACAVVMLLL